MVWKLCKATRDANPNVNPAIAAVNNPINAIFKITDTKNIYHSCYFINKYGNNFLELKL